MITNIEDYLIKGCGRCDRFATPDCSARHWTQGLSDLRQICQEALLVEAVKWGHPCYMHAGRNIAILGAFRRDFRLSFFNAALMKDPKGVLEKQGPNSRHPNMIRFLASAQTTDLAPVILDYLREAMSYAEAGIRPPQEDGSLNWPDELIEALDADPDLADAFHRLTPGRQKSYVLSLTLAKRSETRTARVVSFRNKILVGKGATER